MRRASPQPHLPRWCRLVSWGLIASTTLLLVFAIAAIWVKRQALDDQYWRDTSSELVENEQIRSAVADYLVDQLFANVDVAGAAALGPARAAASRWPGPAAGGLRDVDDPRRQQSARATRACRAPGSTPNSLTHKQFVNLIEDKGTAFEINGNAVVLNLAPLVTEVANRAGIGADVGAKLPGGIAQVDVIKADQVSTLQTAVRLLKSLVIVLALLVPILFALAVFLVPGRRRQALMGVGLGIVAAGLLVTLLRGVVGDELVSSLASTAGDRADRPGRPGASPRRCWARWRSTRPSSAWPWCSPPGWPAARAPPPPCGAPRRRRCATGPSWPGARSPRRCSSSC